MTNLVVSLSLTTYDNFLVFGFHENIRFGCFLMSSSCCFNLFGAMSRESLRFSITTSATTEERERGGVGGLSGEKLRKEAEVFHLNIHEKHLKLLATFEQ